MKTFITFFSVLILIFFTGCTTQPVEPESVKDNILGKETNTEVMSEKMVLNFIATLSGAEEVPPTDTRARGVAHFQLKHDATSLSYKLNVANITNVTMAHIHLAAAGVNGPVVAWLYPSGPPAQLIPGRFNGTLAQGSISAANLLGPLAGQPLEALIDVLQSGNAYVNVHTLQFPGGEIRGQIDIGNSQN